MAKILSFSHIFAAIFSFPHFRNITRHFQLGLKPTVLGRMSSMTSQTKSLSGNKKKHFRTNFLLKALINLITKVQDLFSYYETLF